jgi:hypothetical protein
MRVIPSKQGMNAFYTTSYSLARQVATPLVSIALVAGALALMAGCESEPESHVVSAPPPNVVTPVVTTAPAQVVVAQQAPSGAIILSQAPPVAPQVVVTQTPRPTSDSVWIEGHWSYRTGRYEWVNAQWDRPPHSGDVWYPPHSEPRGDGSYIFYEGHWASN